MRIIDTHQHLFFPPRIRYAWAKDYGLDRDWSLAEYRRAAAGTGIAAAVFMEVDADEGDRLAETRIALDLADDPSSGVIGVVAAARPEHEGFRAELDALVGRKGLKGVRRVLHTQPDDRSRSPRFIEHVRALAGYGLTFDLCLPGRLLPAGIELVRACPDTSFILDHCGMPDVATGALDPWRAQLAEMARSPNVVCKISGIIANAGKNPTAERLRPAIEHVIACFGWDRVVFGSDWPVCTITSPLGGWVDALKTIVASASEGERERLFSRNAERIYRLATPSAQAR
jgi:predicted TIM-barrel fold metal-dependent hydrolase